MIMEHVSHLLVGLLSRVESIAVLDLGHSSGNGGHCCFCNLHAYADIVTPLTSVDS